MSRVIHDVTVQLAAPNENTNYPGKIAEGRYTYEDGVVSLVDHQGKPLKNYTRSIGPEENPRTVAARLTKQLTMARRGGKNLNGFDGPIDYPPLPKWM